MANPNNSNTDNSHNNPTARPNMPNSPHNRMDNHSNHPTDKTSMANKRHHMETPMSVTSQTPCFAKRSLNHIYPTVPVDVIVDDEELRFWLHIWNMLTVMYRDSHRKASSMVARLRVASTEAPHNNR